MTESEKLSQHGAMLAAHEEKINSAHKRIDDNDRVTDGIHRIAANVETLALQVKLQGERMEAWMLKTEQKMNMHNERISALEHKPGKRWETVVGQLVSLAVAAAVGWALAQLGG